MNPITWLEQHPNAAVATIVAGSILLVLFAAWVIHWYVIDARYWLGPAGRLLHRVALGLAGFRREPPLFDEEWQREPWTDDDAAQLVADLTTDLPGPDLHQRAEPLRAGGLHLEPWLERAWWDDPDLVVWDARRQADRCWEILHVEFPRLRAELCGVR